MAGRFIAAEICLSFLTQLTCLLTQALATLYPIPSPLHCAAPTPVHHTPVRLPHLLHHFTICAHSRYLRQLANSYNTSLSARILVACAHTSPLHINCDSTSARILVVWAHSQLTTLPHCLRSFPLLALIHTTCSNAANPSVQERRRMDDCAKLAGAKGHCVIETLRCNFHGDLAETASGDAEW
jgi:hypothetical protein